MSNVTPGVPLGWLCVTAMSKYTYIYGCLPHIIVDTQVFVPRWAYQAIGYYHNDDTLIGAIHKTDRLTRRCGHDAAADAYALGGDEGLWALLDSQSAE